MLLAIIFAQKFKVAAVAALVALASAEVYIYAVLQELKAHFCLQRVCMVEVVTGLCFQLVTFIRLIFNRIARIVLG